MAQLLYNLHSGLDANVLVISDTNECTGLFFYNNARNEVVDISTNVLLKAAYEDMLAASPGSFGVIMVLKPAYENPTKTDVENIIRAFINRMNSESVLNTYKL